MDLTTLEIGFIFDEVSTYRRGGCDDVDTDRFTEKEKEDLNIKLLFLFEDRYGSDFKPIQYNWAIFEVGMYLLKEKLEEYET